MMDGFKHSQGYRATLRRLACAAALVHRNHLFCLYQQNKSSESKVQFRQASNHCKRILETAKLAYAKLGSWDFW